MMRRCKQCSKAHICGVKKRKPGKRAKAKDETFRIRALVFLRADFRCESCGQCYRDPPLQLDHWQGGSGRRLQQQTVANCWALCPHCHMQRTHNLPSVAIWNERFSAFCYRHGYPFRPHIVHQELPR